MSQCRHYSCVTSLAEALAMCDALDPEGRGGVATAIDAYHVWWDWKLADGIAEAGWKGRIAAFHVCDWLVPTEDLLLDRGMMGDGVIDLGGLRALIEAAGFVFERLGDPVTGTPETIGLSNGTIICTGPSCVITGGTAVPEPASLMVLAVGLLGLGAARRRRV